MTDENTEDQSQTAEQETSGLVRRFFQKKAGSAEDDVEEGQKQGVAHVPATLLTVEYVDDSDGMDATLRSMEERLRKMEEQVDSMQHTQAQLIGAVNQQAKDIGKCVEAIGRRIDRLYRRVTGGEATQYRSAGAPTDTEAEEATSSSRMPQMGAEMEVPEGLAPEVADDPDHQNAWRIARVLAADLEAYHEGDVKEGVLYGTFYKLLREPIEKARKTYEERVPAHIVENYDYFSKALDELIVRKRIELEDSGDF
ncbi:MAG: hypothetical protein R6X33_19500 [Candidatus Brocadiia bacterium]